MFVDHGVGPLGIVDRGPLGIVDLHLLSAALKTRPQSRKSSTPRGGDERFGRTRNAPSRGGHAERGGLAENLEREIVNGGD